MTRLVAGEDAVAFEVWSRMLSAESWPDAEDVDEGDGTATRLGTMTARPTLFMRRWTEAGLRMSLLAQTLLGLAHDS